jgi:hypothetical protein
MHGPQLFVEVPYVKSKYFSDTAPTLDSLAQRVLVWGRVLSAASQMTRHNRILRNATANAASASR